MISKEKFVKDALMRHEMRKCAEREEYAIAMINLENLCGNDYLNNNTFVYCGYRNNKSYRGKKSTKFQYQC